MEAFSQNIKNNIRNLPQCTPLQEAAIQPQTFNPMEAECRPSFFTEQVLAQMDTEIERGLEAELMQNDVMQEGKLKSRNLINIDEKEVELIQKSYKHFANAPLYFVIALLVISLIIFLLVPQLKNKLLTLGAFWSFSGLIALISVPIARTLTPTFLQKILESSDFESPQLLLEVINKPLTLAINAITTHLLLFGGIILILGIALLVGGFVVKSSEKQTTT
ncbi:MAG: hypothetical protein U9M98_03220 [Patescibacteria group bacterium]|nr:hypothetical protein [Patescibacteria group bacterium]